MGDARGHLRGEQLGNGRFHAEARADVLLPSGFAREQARGVNFRGHICEHELDGLEIGDGLAEGHTLLRIFQRFLKRALGNPHGLRGNADAPAVERGERDLVAFALGADSVLDGYFAVGEGKLDAGRGVDAEFLLFFADFEARRAALDHQRGDALFAFWRVRIYIDDRGVSGAAVGDPGLRAVHDVAVAFAHGMGRERRGIRPRLRLGEGVAADFFAAREGRQQPLLLLFAAETIDGVAVERILHRENHASRGASSRNLLDGDRVADVVEAGAAVLLGKWNAGEAKLGGLAKRLARKSTGLIQFPRQGLHFRIGEFPHGLLQQLLFFAEFQMQFRSPSGRRQSFLTLSSVISERSEESLSLSAVQDLSAQVSAQS